ncbi:20163_t:CDS:2 [Racocetra fulgida]|uniref:20163_t:CDS:1 n=1 Tax=Racocetra fulgida TaxID=60492 RepID=A0A9N8WD80_9GLOM|nr:20163_t:CDS:2 [Racocetra fulgida]
MEFLLSNYNKDELQENLIDIKDMISSDNENYDDPVFDLEQNLYEYALFNVEDIPILQEKSGKGIGNEYIEEISTIKAKPTTPCVIINNDHREIRRCNRESDKRLRELINVWEIDIDAVNDVNRELHLLGVYLRHFNYNQNNVHSKKLKGKHSTERKFGKSLVFEVLRLRTSLAPYKSTLESLNSLQQYYELIDDIEFCGKNLFVE